MAADDEGRNVVGPMLVEQSETIDAVLALNQHWVPHVGSLSRTQLVEVLGWADRALVVPGDPVGTDGSVSIAGFVILVAPGRDYASPNYRYFQRRLESGAAPGSFLYVDRIAVDPGRQGSGIGRALYDAAFQRARELGAAEVVCEVNLDPPNPDSLAFHARLGFVEVGRQWTDGDTVEVQLLARAL